MAVSKIKGIKASTNKTAKRTLDYIKNEEKTSDVTSDQNVENVLDYATNEEKTSTKSLLDYAYDENKTKSEQEILVSGYRCNPATAELEFEIMRDKYTQAKGQEKTTGEPNIAFHLIQSFSYDDKQKVTAKEMNEMGLELAAKLSHYQAVVATHLDRNHYHNHIVFNAYSIDDRKKYHDCKETYQQIRDWNDEISISRGLSVVVNPSFDKVHSYAEWQAIKDGSSWKENIRVDINNTKEFCKSYDELQNILKKAGYEIKQNARSYSYRAPGADKWVRDTRLGHEYTKESLESYFDLTKDVEMSSKNQLNRNLVEIKSFNPKTGEFISPISRYSSAGVRRSGIEMNILMAIRLIKTLGGDTVASANEVFPENPVFGSSSWKIQTLVDTLTLINEEEIVDEEDLANKIENAGKELSIAKKKMNKSKAVHANMIRTNETIELLKEFSELVENVEDKERLFFVEDASVSKIRKNKAKEDPMTAEQSSKLYKLLESNPDLKLAVSFKELTSEQTKEIIDYLSDNSIEKPVDVISVEEWKQKRVINKYNAIISKKNKGLQNRFNSEKMSDAQKKLVVNILSKMEKNGVDVNALTKYDAMQIINHYNNKLPAFLSNESVVERANEKQINAIGEILKNNAAFKSDVDYKNISKQNASEFIAAAFSTKAPAVLSKEPASDKQKELLGKMLNRLGYKTDVSMDEINKKEAVEMFKILNAKSFKSDIFAANTQRPSDKQKEFILSKLDDNLHLTKSIDRLSKDEASLCINYLINPSNNRPFLFSNSKIEYAEKEDIVKFTQLCKKQNVQIEVPLESLTKKDVEQATNHILYKNSDLNVLNSEFISEGEQNELRQLIPVENLLRDVTHISKEEYSEIKKYINDVNQKSSTFSVHAEDSASDEQKEELEILCRINNIDVDLKSLNKKQYSEIVNYIIEKNNTPGVFKNEQKELTTEELYSLISKYDEETQSAIIAVRDAKKYLKSRGLESEESVEKYQENFKISIAEDKAVEEEYDKCSIEYQALKKIEYNLNLTKNKAFTCDISVEELQSSVGTQTESKDDEKTVEEEVIEKLGKVVDKNSFVKTKIR